MLPKFGRPAVCTFWENLVKRKYKINIKKYYIYFWDRWTLATTKSCGCWGFHWYRLYCSSTPSWVCWLFYITPINTYEMRFHRIFISYKKLSSYILMHFKIIQASPQWHNSDNLIYIYHFFFFALKCETATLNLIISDKHITGETTMLIHVPMHGTCCPKLHYFTKHAPVGDGLLLAISIPTGCEAVVPDVFIDVMVDATTSVWDSVHRCNI